LPKAARLGLGAIKQYCISLPFFLFRQSRLSQKAGIAKGGSPWFRCHKAVLYIPAVFPVPTKQIIAKGRNCQRRLALV